MVRTTLHHFLYSVPQAVAVWMVLSAVAFVAVASRSGPGLRRRMAGRRRSARRKAAAVTARERAVRHAAESVGAADRAAGLSRCRRREWQVLRDAADLAWEAFDVADRTARRAAQAAAFPTPRTTDSPTGFAERERYLHRAAAAACRRLGVPSGPSRDLFAHRHEWDPCRLPVGQEATLSRTVRDHLYLAYRRSAAQERQAWQAADAASAVMRGLNDEAADAALRIGQVRRTAGQRWWAEQWTPEAVRDTRPARRRKPAPAGHEPVPVREPVEVRPPVTVRRPVPAREPVPARRPVTVRQAVPVRGRASQGLVVADGTTPAAASSRQELIGVAAFPPRAACPGSSGRSGPQPGAAGRSRVDRERRTWASPAPPLSLRRASPPVRGRCRPGRLSTWPSSRDSSPVPGTVADSCSS
jgi:hypothetical protein